jgi:5-methylcytosine-specific restriction enzyme subunit McrC
VPLVQLCEWGRKSCPDWPVEVRGEMNDLAREWARRERLNAPPIEWIGDTICARQFVGVVECGEFQVEIFPKLDKKLLAGGALDEERQNTALGHLLRLLDAALFEEHIENGQALLQDEPLAFPDIWAFLLARHLERELRRGVPHAYITRRDDLPRVRGKIELKRQIGTHFGRADRLACVWDEYSGGNALNRLFRCALDWLRPRVHHGGAKRGIGRCLSLLEEAQLVSPREALSGAQHLSWTRANRRFEPHLGFAVRLLRGQSPDFGARNARSWVFLTDMNALFEAFCARALEARLKTRVWEQELVGHLFHSPKATKQLADFVWRDGETWFVGDAKWKLLGSGAPLINDEEVENTRGSSRSLSPADVRQLTTYSELLKRREKLQSTPEMWILYPTMSEEKAFPAPLETWNGGRLRRVPVHVCNWNTPGDALEL